MLCSHTSPVFGPRGGVEFIQHSSTLSTHVPLPFTLPLMPPCRGLVVLWVMRCERGTRTFETPLYTVVCYCGGRGQLCEDWTSRAAARFKSYFDYFSGNHYITVCRDSRVTPPWVCWDALNPSGQCWALDAAPTGSNQLRSSNGEHTWSARYRPTLAIYRRKTGAGDGHA